MVKNYRYCRVFVQLSLQENSIMVLSNQIKKHLILSPHLFIFLMAKGPKYGSFMFVLALVLFLIGCSLSYSFIFAGSNMLHLLENLNRIPHSSSQKPLT